MKRLPKLPIPGMAIIFSAFACSKMNLTKSQETLTVSLKEYKTNLPIQGAQVNFYKRGAFDFLNCGCYLNDLFAEQYSDASGTCSAMLPAGSSPLSEITFYKSGHYSKP